MCNKKQNRNQGFANETFIVLVLFILLAIILGAVLV
jgi:hypothetical protein